VRRERKTLFVSEMGYFGVGAARILGGGKRGRRGRLFYCPVPSCTGRGKTFEKGKMHVSRQFGLQLILENG
jgi:hypothetical protein